MCICHFYSNGDNIWIVKAWNLGRGMDLHITRNLVQIIRLVNTIPKVSMCTVCVHGHLCICGTALYYCVYCRVDFNCELQVFQKLTCDIFNDAITTSLKMKRPLGV